MRKQPRRVHGRLSVRRFCRLKNSRTVRKKVKRWARKVKRWAMISVIVGQPSYDGRIHQSRQTKFLTKPAAKR